DFWDEHAAFLKVAGTSEIFIKAVITNDTTEDDVLKAATIVEQVNPNILFIIQPNSYELKEGIVGKCVDLEQKVSQKLHNVRVMPQMHKMLKVR
ncbi:MAG: 7-carboxy-7-deazaguanine synthase, partial [Candidatus Omnitrophota bacterium]